MLVARPEPADAGPISLTECVYAAGPPGEGVTITDSVVRYRSVPYLGILTLDGKMSGENRGTVDIELDRESGSGTIHGTLAIRNSVLGDFDGEFSGTYERGMWRGRGRAAGFAGSAGRQLTIDLEARDPAPCPAHSELGDPIDCVLWTATAGGS